MGVRREDRLEIWQERGPLEDLFPAASTDVLALLLDEWPFGAGKFEAYRDDPAGGMCPALRLLVVPGHRPIVEPACGDGRSAGLKGLIDDARRAELRERNR